MQSAVSARSAKGTGRKVGSRSSHKGKQRVASGRQSSGNRRIHSIINPQFVADPHNASAHLARDSIIQAHPLHQAQNSNINTQSKYVVQQSNYK